MCVFVRASACLIRFVYNNSNQHKLCFCQCLHKVSAQLRVCVSVYTLALFVVPPPPFLLLPSSSSSFSSPCLLLTNTLTRYDHKKLTRKVAAVATVVAVVDCCMSARATHLTAASAAVAAGVAGVSLSLLNDEQSDTFSIPNQLDGRQ